MERHLRTLLLILTIPFLTFGLGAQEKRERSGKPVLQAYGAVSFPIQTGFESYDTVGYGGNINAFFPLKKLYPFYVGGNFGYSYHKLRMENSVSLLSLSATAGVAVDVTDRFQVTAGAGVGAYAGFLNENAVNPDTGDVYDNQSGAALFWQAGAGANFFLNPALSLGVYGSFDHYVDMFYGIRAGVFASMHFEGLNPRVNISEPRIDALYPSLSRSYDEDGVERLEIVNNERFPMEDVTVTYQIEDLMPEPAVSGTFPRLEPGERADTSLLTLLGTNGLLLEDDVPKSSTVVLSYTLGSRERELTREVNVHVMNRNALVWDDDTKAASFIDTRDAEVLRFSKEVSRMVMNEGRRAVNSNLRISMAMFEAMGAYRISYVRDPHSPAFVDAHDNAEIVDYVQYPAQTLRYRGGDCDDLSILYCSLLESVGIETALITVPGHIYPAVNLAVPPTQADKLFDDVEKLVFHDDSTWLPVEITLVGQDFQEALDMGAKQWQEADLDGRAVIYPVGEAWDAWENPGSPPGYENLADLDIAETESAYIRELNRHLSVRLAAMTGPLEARLAADPGDLRVLNRLGIVYAGHGLLDRAEDSFRDAAGRGLISAEVNLGNVYILRERPVEAMAIFQGVLDAHPDNKVALAGMARAGSMAGEQLKVETYLAELHSLDPAMGAQLAGLSNRSGEARASAALEGSVAYWADEE